MRRYFLITIMMVMAFIMPQTSHAQSALEVLKKTYGTARYYSNYGGWYSVGSDSAGVQGACNGKGILVVPCQYDIVEKFDGYYSVKLRGKEGVCDEQGNMIIPCVYDFICRHGNYYSVRNNGRKGAFDLDGKLIVPIKYTSVVCMDDYFRVELGKQTGAYDLRGNILVPLGRHINFYQKLWEAIGNNHPVIH